MADAAGEANKELLRQFWQQVWNEGHTERVHLYFDPAYVGHTPGQTLDFAGMQTFIASTQHALADMRLNVALLLAEGEYVTTRWIAHGTHRGELMGVPATGKAISVTGITISRLADGKIVEEWEDVDYLGLLQQLGALPAGV